MCFGARTKEVVRAHERSEPRACQGSPRKNPATATIIGPDTSAIPKTLFAAEGEGRESVRGHERELIASPNTRAQVDELIEEPTRRRRRHDAARGGGSDASFVVNGKAPNMGQQRGGEGAVPSRFKNN